jgi:alpha-L-fucosidase 2
MPEGGTQETFPERILVEGANAATVLVTADTSFGDEHPGGVRTAETPAARVDRDLSAAAAKPYAGLLRAHLADHQRLYRRVALQLGAAVNASAAAIPTDKRLERVRDGASDPALDALYFQFGRYLLIASSRPGDLPANLQGLWNDSLHPPWDSDYHLNINLCIRHSRLTAISEARPALPRCCSKATRARSICSPRCRRRGPTAHSAACAPVAASKSMSRGRTASS